MKFVAPLVFSVLNLACTTDEPRQAAPSLATTPLAAAKPPAPVIEQPADGSVTHETRPVFAGTAPPLALVTVVLDDTATLRTGADATGAWSVRAEAPLGGGHHAVAATVVDAGVSSARAVSKFQVDRSVPSRPTIALPAVSSTNVALVQLTGEAEAGSSVALTVDDGVVAVTTTATGLGTWSSGCVGPRVHTLFATATNAAGRRSAPRSRTPWWLTSWRRRCRSSTTPPMGC